MEEAEKMICDFIHGFVDKHWDNINKKKCELKCSKDYFLKEVKSDVQTAIWVALEVADWGMNKPYLTDVKVGNDERKRVLKINNRYIKLTMGNDYIFSVGFVEPKYKQVEYFD